MARSLSAAAALALALVPGAAAAETITGEVIATHGRRSTDGAHIVTDAIVRSADGRERVVTQLGGHAGNKTMVVFHGPPPLEPGLRVRIDAHPHADPRRAAWVADVVDVVAGVGGGPYVRTPAKKSGRPLAWAKSCVQVSWAVEGTTAIAGDAERAVIEQAIAAWNDGVAGCSYLNLVGLGPVEHEVGEDQVNLIKFRDTSWCRPAVDGDDARCHSPNAAGITTVIYVDDPDDPRDAEIVDADIELNGFDFAISVNGQTASLASCQADLANTLVHELGHLLGLDHSCRKAGDNPRVDHTGAAVPLCSAAASNDAITEATMYPEQQCGETKKATLSPDDTAAICAVYPTGDDPRACGPPDDLSGGCCDAGGRGGPSALLALATVVGLVSRRRTRRPSRRSPG